MKTLKLSTREPEDLCKGIEEKIFNNEIRSWEIDDQSKVISHKGEQYRNHFYFETKVDDLKGILEFNFHSSGTSEFADSRAFQLLERMLLSHFKSRIEILK
ncbi:hypothetical protein Q73A0000_05910 [Kaistella flava (ex Peng et al. 2021)]|uniref:Uncharacterized protein n=1 Tax=Kaistella flava (ex Peng et al. 2021) TaxID=2038776 RepID=A0A7M2Y7X3_9FLAO|nr:hypothetical protein [Kaistella flava (ex Peng et al. 2021)]QOW09929.1 hypothetical protein Q73A0000_05910 [Kaistella flava (ex Peng et al. 2021)]